MQDNLKETQATIIDLITSNAATSDFLKHTPDAACFMCANYQVRVGEQHVDAECAININIDPKSYDADPVVDEQGNEWQEMHVTTHISWPSYSNNPAYASVARAALMLDVSRLAQKIVEHCATPIWKLHRTAEQVAEYQERLARRHLESTVTSIVERAYNTGALTGMRVGSVRFVKDQLVEKMTCTSMEVPLTNGKTYAVRRDDTIPTLATITRTA